MVKVPIENYSAQARTPVAGNESPRSMTGAGFAFLIGLSAILLWGCQNQESRLEQDLARIFAQLELTPTPEILGELEQLHNRFPQRKDILERLAFSHAAIGNHAEAAWYFMALVNLDPDEKNLLLLAAQSLEEAGDHAGASLQYQEFLRHAPQEFLTWGKLMRSEMQRGRPREAIEAGLQWYRLRPSSEAAISLAKLFSDVGNIAQSRIWYQTVINRNESQTGEARAALLLLELGQRNLPVAERLMREIRQHHPELARRTDLSQASRQITAWRESQDALAKLEEEQKRLEQERLEARRRAQEEETARRAALRRQEEATPTEQSAETRPPRPLVGDLPAQTPRGEEPVRAPRQTGSAIEDLLRTARDHISGERWSAAVNSLWIAIGQDDRPAEPWALLARAYRAQRLYSEAEACILEARRRDPGSQEFAIEYLNILRESKPVSFFIQEAEVVLRQFPRNASVALAIARAHEETRGSRGLAIQAYERYLRIAPADAPERAEAEAAIARLRRS